MLQICLNSEIILGIAQVQIFYFYEEAAKLEDNVSHPDGTL